MRKTVRIGSKGQVVIPEASRDSAQLHPGDVVDFEIWDDLVVLVARPDGAGLGGRFARSGMAARLLEDRAPDVTTYLLSHRHILEHENRGMMGQDVVVRPGERPALRHERERPAPSTTGRRVPRAPGQGRPRRGF